MNIFEPYPKIGNLLFYNHFISNKSYNNHLNRSKYHSLPFNCKIICRIKWSLLLYFLNIYSVCCNLFSPKINLNWLGIFFFYETLSYNILRVSNYFILKVIQVPATVFTKNWISLLIYSINFGQKAPILGLNWLAIIKVRYTLLHIFMFVTY
jgi:hypothetical protein